MLFDCDPCPEQRATMEALGFRCAENCMHEKTAKWAPGENLQRLLEGGVAKDVVVLLPQHWRLGTDEAVAKITEAYFKAGGVAATAYLRGFLGIKL